MAAVLFHFLSAATILIIIWQDALMNISCTRQDMTLQASHLQFLCVKYIYNLQP